MCGRETSKKNANAKGPYVNRRMGHPSGGPCLQLLGGKWEAWGRISVGEFAPQQLLEAV